MSSIAKGRSESAEPPRGGPKAVREEPAQPAPRPVETAPHGVGESEHGGWKAAVSDLVETARQAVGESEHGGWKAAVRDLVETARQAVGEAARGGWQSALRDVNDAPVLDLNGAAPGTSTTVAYSAGNPPIKIAPAGTVVDPDSPDFHGGSLRVGFTGNTGAAGDALAIATDATVTLTGNEHSAQRAVKIDGTLIGTVSGGTNGTDLVITLHSTATAAQVQILLEHIGYANSSANPSTAPRTVTFTLVDGDGTANGGHDTGTATATITYPQSGGTNVPPVLTGDLAASVAEGGSYVIRSADLGFSDPDDVASGVTFTVSNPINGTVR